MCLFICYTFSYILFIYFQKNIVLEWGGGSYRILNSARTQRVVQHFCSGAFQLAHARPACGPSSSSDVASHTVAGKSHRKHRATTFDFWREPCFPQVNRLRVLPSEVQNCYAVGGRNITYRQPARMMFRQVLDVDKVITQLLAGRKKTDKQANICVFWIYVHVIYRCSWHTLKNVFVLRFTLRT